ncbi:MAG: hypothetical protein ACOC4E_01030 [Patescibacteria group bacterium]
MWEFSTYHRFLRIASVVTALLLVFQSGLVSDRTAIIAAGTQGYLANAIGMTAGVEPTPLNEYTAALTEKERELAAREAALESREIAVEVRGQGGAVSGTTTYLLAGALFILLALIVLNYTLDFLRARDMRRSDANVPV